MSDGTEPDTAFKMLSSSNNATGIYVFGSIGETMVGGSGTDYLELSLSSFTTPISLRLTDQELSAVDLGANTNIQGFETFNLVTGSGADTLDLRNFTLKTYAFDEWNTPDSSFDLSAGKDAVFVSSATRGTAVIYNAEVLNADFSLFDRHVTIYGGGVWTVEDDINIQFAAGQLTAITATGGSGDDTLSGTEGSDKLSGGAGKDQIKGKNGADTLIGGTGNDEIDGGKGEDLAIYSGLRANFLITRNGDGTAYIRDLRSGKANLGTDKLVNVENVKFDDGQFIISDIATNRAPYELEFGNQQISEKTPVDSLLGFIGAFDPDGDRITYSLSSNPGGKFKIVGSEVRLNAPLDYETTKSYSITIVATDTKGASTSASFVFDVLDMDEAPVISSNGGGSTASITVDENTKAVTKVVAADPERKPVTYSISGADWALFNIDTKTGALTFKKAPDYETPRDAGKDGIYVVKVWASDGWASGSQIIKIKVDDVNEAPKNITLKGTTVTENATVGTIVGTFSAVDPEGGKLTYKLKDGGSGFFKIVGDKLIVAKALDYEKTHSDTIQIQARDESGLYTTKIFSINVQDIAEIRAPIDGGVIKGGSGSDILEGRAGNDTLFGGAGRDILKGARGSDKLYGGSGADDLYGGNGQDIFVFKSQADLTTSINVTDTIFDFSQSQKDVIDLSAIDANIGKSGNQAFTFIKSDAFTGKAGELRYEKKASETYVYGDTDGNGKADFVLHFDDALNLAKADFLL
nr:cadherin domain-containing protein [uncultured Shinella sp.]